MAISGGLRIRSCLSEPLADKRVYNRQGWQEGGFRKKEHLSLEMLWVQGKLDHITELENKATMKNNNEKMNWDQIWGL